VSLFLKQGSFADVEPNYLHNTVLDFARPLIHELHWLGKEMSASHVLRSLVCFLSGLPPVAEKKGKKSKHQHSVVLAEPLDAMLQPGTFYFAVSKTFPVPAVFQCESFCVFYCYHHNNNNYYYDYDYYHSNG
jgi:hypothetical protein